MPFSISIRKGRAIPTSYIALSCMSRPDPTNFPNFPNFHENGGLNPSQLDAILMSTQLDPCDFNQDTNCDGMDINLLMAEIASGNNSTSFDINGDGVVDVLDRDEWLAAAGTQNIGAAYLVGDANLDGTVDGLDFLAWNTNKFSPVSDWTGGEFTGNGNVDGQDFVTWNANKFQSSNDLAVVPEPKPSLGLLALAVSSLAAHRRRGSRMPSRRGTYRDPPPLRRGSAS